jgi:general L-amino acid transport system substrate-binding protein
MIMFGKVFAALIWAFWLIAVSSTAEGQNVSPEYNPTYGSTFDRVVKRGHVICGTNDEFPGFSQETWTQEEGDRWVGFDVDLCRAIAAAIFGDSKAIEFEVVNGKTRFEFLIDGTIDVLSAATTYTYTRNVAKKLEFMPTTYYDGQGFIVRKTLGVSSAKQTERT